MNLKVKKINPDAILPSYAHEGDAGLDLHSVEELVLAPDECKLVKTGIVIELPANTEAQVRPRSGLALKHQITLLNTPGTIDYGYRGEVGIIMKNFGSKSFEIKKGMKIAQMVVKPVFKVSVQEVDQLSGTERGSGGFGSTGQ
jgi:dUTP pyrophosphatase